MYKNATLYPLLKLYIWCWWCEDIKDLNYVYRHWLFI